MPKVAVECTNCKKTIYRWPSGLKNRKYGNMCSNKCIGLFRTQHLVGSLGANFQGGYSFDRKYIDVSAHWHPNKKNNNTVYLHRLIMEVKLGRFLEEGEIVHHKDGNKENNHWDNLEVMFQSQHATEHLANGTVDRDELNGRFIKGDKNGK